MVEIGSGAKRKQKDYKLTRYAVYWQKLKKDNIQNKKGANETHYNIGKIVRKAIKEAGRNYARKFTYA